MGRRNSLGSSLVCTDTCVLAGHRARWRYRKDAVEPTLKPLWKAFPLATMLLAGCASYSGWGLQPGVSTGADVRRVMGKPVKTCPLEQGTQNWIYPRGPAGLHTFNARIDRDGVLRSLENVLEESGFARVVKGTSSKDDVLCIFGPPIYETYFRARNELVWDYRFRDPWGYPSRFHVLFDDAGTVTGTMQIREDVPSPDR